jgi:hypothetical protein
MLYTFRLSRILLTNYLFRTAFQMIVGHRTNLLVASETGFSLTVCYNAKTPTPCATLILPVPFFSHPAVSLLISNVIEAESMTLRGNTPSEPIACAIRILVFSCMMYYTQTVSRPRQNRMIRISQPIHSGDLKIPGYLLRFSFHPPKKKVPSPSFPSSYYQNQPEFLCDIELDLRGLVLPWRRSLIIAIYKLKLNSLQVIKLQDGPTLFTLMRTWTISSCTQLTIRITNPGLRMCRKYLSGPILWWAAHLVIS